MCFAISNHFLPDEQSVKRHYYTPHRHPRTEPLADSRCLPRDGAETVSRLVQNGGEIRIGLECEGAKVRARANEQEKNSEETREVKEGRLQQSEKMRDIVGAWCAVKKCGLRVFEAQCTTLASQHNEASCNECRTMMMEMLALKRSD